MFICTLIRILIIHIGQYFMPIAKASMPEKLVLLRQYLWISSKSQRAKIPKPERNQAHRYHLIVQPHDQALKFDVIFVASFLKAKKSKSHGRQIPRKVEENLPSVTSILVCSIRSLMLLSSSYGTRSKYLRGLIRNSPFC